MLHASTRKLIDRLAEMTELNKLDWTESEAGQIIYSTEGYSVSLTEDPNELVITSKDGKELERASADELAATQNDDGMTYTAIVSAMTVEAARIARGTEAAISSLLAGMEEQASEPEVAVVEDTPSEEALTEDPIDDTNVVAADTIETVTETSDADEDDTVETSEPETADPEPVSADAETEDEAAAETMQDETSDDADDTAAAILTASETPETEVESESDVTEAVARLADEVNQREDSGLDAAAASAVGAVALAAGLATDDEEETSTEDTPDAATDATSDITAAPLSDPEPVKYVPFGLEATETEVPVEAAAVSIADAPESVEAALATDAEDAPEATEEPALEASELATSSEPHIDPVAAFAATTDETPDAEADNAEPEIEETATVAPFGAVAAQSDDDATLAETEEETNVAAEASETAAPISFVGAASEPESDAERAAEPVSQAESSPEMTDAEATPEAPEQFAASAPVEVGQPEPVTTPIPDPTPAAPEVAPVQNVAIDTPSPITQQSYSLSGIGAGFGLGALSAKTEASGIPGPSATPESEKVVIDATDDVLPEIDGKPALPEGVPSVAETVAASESTSTEPSSDAPESDILKPRTRFNPWD